MEDLLEGRTPARQLELPGEAQAPEPQWREVNVRGVRVERVREFGQVYLALSLWRRLGLHRLLKRIDPFPGREEVPWEGNRLPATLARFCAQASELGIAERWYQRTALEDLLESRGRRSMTTGCTADWTRCTSTRATDPAPCSNVTRAGLVWASSS